MTTDRLSTRHLLAAATTALAMIAAPALAQDHPDQDHAPAHAAPAHAAPAHRAPPAHHATVVHRPVVHHRVVNHTVVHNTVVNRTVVNRGGPAHWQRGGYYRGNRVVFVNWHQYNLQSPPPGYEWVQDGNELVLIALATGLIADTYLIASGY